MKRAKIAGFLGLVLALLAGWWFLRADPHEVADVPQLPASPAVGSAPPATEGAPAVGVRAPDEMQGSDGEPAAATRTLSEPASAAIPAGDAKRLTVFGRMVDELDKPLTGATARLQAYKVWAEGVDVPRFPGKTDLRGFEVATDAEGVFRFDVPWPTNDTTWLKLEPDAFHDSAEVFFGAGRDDARPPITVVDADLGLFRLAATGAVRGRVTDESGKPLADAQLGMGSEPVYTIGRDSTSEANGNYVIAHVPPGEHGVKAKCVGYLSGFRKPVSVRAGAFTDAVDFALAAAPTLTGTVLDVAGAPIEGAKLLSRPFGSGSGAHAVSGKDGSFTMFLPQAGAHSLEATKEGFRPWHQNDRTTRYEPGTSGICVEMAPSPTWELFVMDAQTKKPVEEFGVQVLRDNSAHLEHPVVTEVAPGRSSRHSAGTMNVELRPGSDVLVVSARGYESLRIDLEPGPPPDGRILAALVGSCAVVGRLLQGAEPAPSVRLVLDGGDAQAGPAGSEIRFRPARALSPAEEQRWTGVPSHAFRRTSRRFAVADEQGRFRFEGVGSGVYQLGVLESAGFAVERAPFLVPSADVDLGDLQVVRGAAILGEVLAPPGRSRSGLKIRLDDHHTGPQRVTDGDGRFRFQGLPAGLHELHLERVPGAIADTPPLCVELASGEERELVVDASGAGTCEVCLTVLLGSVPAAAVDVEIAVAAEPGSAEGSSRQDASGRRADFTRLGKTDARGRVCGSVRARGSGRVVIRGLPNAIPLEHPTLEIELALDARVEQTVTFETGRLVVALPQQTVLTTQCLVRVFQARSGDGRRVQTHYATFDPRQPVRSWTFEHALAGECELQVELVPSHRGIGEQPSVLFSSTQAATIRAGETTEVQLH